jgi:RHS repeat-associated protein
MQPKNILPSISHIDVKNRKLKGILRAFSIAYFLYSAWAAIPKAGISSFRDVLKKFLFQRYDKIGLLPFLCLIVSFVAAPAKADTYTSYYSGTITVINLSTNTYHDVVIQQIYHDGGTDSFENIEPNDNDFTPGSVGTGSGVVLGVIDYTTGQWYNPGEIIWPIRYLWAVAVDVNGTNHYSANVLPYAGPGMTGTLFFEPGNILPVNDAVDGIPLIPNLLLNLPSGNYPPGDCGGNNNSGSGMPVWSVSEPFISLWLHDEPLGYQPAIGPRVSFDLAYKQRETDGIYGPAIFSVGKKWAFSWFSYVTQDYNTNNVVYFPGGGATTYYTTNDYQTGTTLIGSITNGFTLTYPDGSKDVYNEIVTNSYGDFLEALLSQCFDAQSNKTTLNYYSYSPSVPVARLQNVVDADGRTNLIYYNNSNAYSTNLISKVVDPFGRTVYLNYNANGDLTNIIDVMSNSTAISYDTNDWVTNMVTPYGTTSFAITDSGTNPPPNGRSVLVTRPDNSHEIYLYEDSAPGITNTYPSSAVPNTGTLSNTFDNSDLNLRNSFHWGPRQFENLNAAFLAGGTTNNWNPTLLTNSDFSIARMQHWLTSTSSVVGDTLSQEREPSPDAGGTIEGQITWYDYAGKTNSEYEGTQVVPLYVARVLPDGTTYFTRNDCNLLGNVLTNVSTYTSSGSVAYRTNLYAYAANGIDAITVTNALGVQVSSNAYNAYHEITTNFDALNELTTFTYNTNQQPIKIVAPNGLVTTNYYSTTASSGSYHFLTRQIATGYATNSFTYTNDLPYIQTNALGLITTNTWDKLQRLVSTKFPDGTTISNVYTILDLTATKDRLTNWTYYAYDPLRRNTSITNALNKVTTFGYCTCGALEFTVDAANNTNQFFYDNQGNLTNTLGPDGYSLTRTYNLLRQVINTTDSGGDSVSSTYNNQGLLTTVSNLFGQVQSISYDILDRPTSSVNANDVTTLTTYDNLNRPLTRSYPDGGVEHWAYTANLPAVTSYTNQIGNTVLYAYDALNRKTNEVDVGVTTNKFTYDGGGDLLKFIDGKSQTNTWIYDLYGRATTNQDALGTNIFIYKYDADNRLTNRWTPAKTNTYYRYDAVGNLTNIVYPVSSNIVLKYDADNRLTNLVDAVGATIYSYDGAGQLLSEDGPWTNDTVSYTYTNRLRTGLSLSQPGGSWSQSYGYDSARRLTSLTSPAGAFGYTYDPLQLQRVVGVSLPNNANVVNAYDSVARMLSTKLMNSGGTILDAESYNYNQGNQRLTETNTAGDYRNYSYDNVGELTTAIGRESSGTSRLQEQLGYLYDAAGNLNVRTNNALIQNFTVNKLNELTNLLRSGTFTVAGVTSSGATNVTVNTTNATLYADHTFAATNFTLANGTNIFTAIAKDFLGNVATNIATNNLLVTNSYSYDLNGNVLTNGTKIFAYDDENQLISVLVTSNWQSQFVYDGKFRRRIEKDFSWSGSSWTETNEIHFIYDGNTVIQERNTNNTPLVTYTRGVGGLLARTDTNSSTYYHADGNGNITLMLDASQNIVAKYLYDPFGNILSQSGPMANANVYRFASKEWNANAGFYYFGRRYYDPILQRFLNRDPMQENGGLNLYAYCGNNPVSLMDMLGLCPQWWDDLLQSLEYDAEDATDFLADVGILQQSDDGYLYDPILQQQLEQLAPNFINSSQPINFPDDGGITDLSIDYFNTAMTAYGANALADSLSGLFAADSTQPMITVIGSQADVEDYVGLPGFNTFTGEGVTADGVGSLQQNLDRANALIINDAIVRGDTFWQVTDPAAHEALLKSIPENPQSAYLNLEIPMLNEYEGVNVVPVYPLPP